MKCNFKLLTAIFLSLIIGLGYYGGWWDEIGAALFPSANTVTATPLRPDPPAVVITRPKLTGWQDLKKYWEIEALRIWQSDNGNLIHFEKITSGLIFSVKDKRVEFLADWARLDRLRSELYLGGGLTAKIDQGSIMTDEGVMNYKAEEMFCPKKVIYQENERTIKANQMKIKFKKDEILLEGDVQFIEKNDQMTADGLLYNIKEKKYYLIAPKGITIYP